MKFTSYLWQVRIHFSRFSNSQSDEISFNFDDKLQTIIKKKETLKRTFRGYFWNIGTFFSNFSFSPLFDSTTFYPFCTDVKKKGIWPTFSLLPRGFHREHYAGRATYACKKAAAGNRQPGNTCLASLQPSHESLKERRSLVQPINASFSAATPPTRPTRNAH